MNFDGRGNAAPPANSHGIRQAPRIRLWRTITPHMLTRRRLALGTLLITTACGNAEKEKAAELQRQADDRIAKIEAEARDRVAAAEKKVTELQEQLVEAGAQAKAEANEEVSKMKTEAD